MLSLGVSFLYILSVASCVIIYNTRDQQRQYNPYSLRNQQYHSNQASPLHPRLFFLGSPLIRALLGLGANGLGSSTFSGISGLFGNSSLFNLQFPRVQACTSQFAGRSFGSCLILGECLIRSGLPAGICDFGLTTCCISSGSSSIPVASFTKTSQTTSPATFTILRTSPEFCQVRVDFVKFNIGQVNYNGYCTYGFWTVNGQANTNVPILCGLNDGQHVYLNFDSNGNPITMTVFSNNLQSDDWNIKITQIRCTDTANIAPSGCLQYYPESTGQVQSFNFRNIVSRPPQNSTAETYQLSNLDYYICLGSSLNTYSTITWTKGVGASNYYFVMSGFIGLLPPNLVGSIQAAVFDPDCTTTSLTYDYVEILSGKFTNSKGEPDSRNQFCGVGFPTSVTSTVQPFRLHVVTDSNERDRVPYEGSVGFSLSFNLI
ncbi:UNVERIFIED_CONTAM: hypothetical protein RMT77_009777 [Armadillidium vulgare]